MIVVDASIMKSIQRHVLLTVLLLLLMCSISGQQAAKSLVQCADSARYRPITESRPDEEQGDDDKHPFDPRKNILIVGHEGLGLGNYLISFPSAYNFAVATGRDVVLADGTLIGEFCNIVMCGFHSYSYWIIKNELMAQTATDLKKKREQRMQELREIIAAPMSPKPNQNQTADRSVLKNKTSADIKAVASLRRRTLRALAGETRETAKQQPMQQQQQHKSKPKPKAAREKSEKVSAEKTEDKKQGVPSLRAFEFLSHFRGEYPLETFPAIHVYGYLHKTAWVWELEDVENRISTAGKNAIKAKDKYSSRVYDCLEKVTRCKNVNSELHCLDRHALQQLVVGPFVNDAGMGKKDGLGSSDRSLSFEYLNKTTRNLPDHIADSLLHKKFLDTPRIDVAVHLRNMFHFFEESEDEDESKARGEVAAWLSSTQPHEGIAVFREIEKQILNVTRSTRLKAGGSCKRVTVFVSADNSLVKDAFVDYLEARLPCGQKQGGHRRKLKAAAKGKTFRESLNMVANFFIPAKEKGHGQLHPKVETAEVVQERERAEKRRAKRMADGRAKNTTSGGSGKAAGSKVKVPVADYNTSDAVEQAIYNAKHPQFASTLVGAPTRAPTAKILTFTTRPNPEQLAFQVIHSLPGVYHSRQIKKLNSHGTTRCVCVNEFSSLVSEKQCLSASQLTKLVTFLPSSP